MTHPQPCVLSGNYLRKKWISSGYQNMNRRLIRLKKANQSCVSMTPSPATPTEGQVAHPVTIASPSTSPEKVPTETTSPVELPMTTAQAPKRRVSEREKQNGWTIMNIDFLEQCYGTPVFWALEMLSVNVTSATLKFSSVHLIIFKF